MFSVVIPAHNEENYIGNTIDKIKEAFFHGAPEEQYEIIVGDNASTDKTREICEVRGCKVVLAPERSISKARNAGANEARGEWIIFIDADSYPSAELVAEVVRNKNNNQYIGFGAVVRVVGGKEWFKRSLEKKNASMVKRGWCLGAFMCCRRSSYIEVGGFDEEIYAFEEEYFVRALQRKGESLNQVFRVLDQHFYFSGRKSETKGKMDFIKLALRIWFSKRKTIRSKDKLDYWYS